MTKTLPAPFAFNMLCATDCPTHFTGFVVSPVMTDTHGDSHRCTPANRHYWRIDGFHAQAEEWVFIHESNGPDVGSAIVALETATGHKIEYRDPQVSYSNTSAATLADMLTFRIHDEIPSYDKPEDFRDDDFDNHPLADLREQLLSALEAKP